MRAPPLRNLFLAVAVLLAMSGCADLPNDVGVRHYRAAAQAWQAAHVPMVTFWNDDPTIRGERKIVINLTIQQAFFYHGEDLVGRSTISSGRRDFETPPGKYRVVQKDEHHVSSQYGVLVARSGAVLVHDADAKKTPRPKGARFVGAPMPYFLRFTEGYGMHAGFVPRYRASHGCVRMPEKMAQRFFGAATVGTRVEVIEPPVRVDR